MQKYVALFRGLNVGGHNKVTMNDLKATLTSADCEKVTTYIQSGNAVFLHGRSAEGLEPLLEAAFEKQFGYHVEIVVRDQASLQQAFDAFPFFAPDREEKFMMTGFAKSQPAHDAQATLEAVAVVGEYVRAGKHHVDFYFGNGAGRSKLAALNFSKKIGTPITIRNRRTISKLLELMDTL